MKTPTPFIRLGALLLLSAIVAGAAAQSQDAATAPVVGDKWTFRYDTKGDKNDPYVYSLQVTAVEGPSTWLRGESSEPHARWPRYVWRQDVASAEYVERFAFDEAAVNGAGKRIVDRTKNESWLKFPLAVGKKFTVKRPWDNGQGFDEFNAEVQAFEKMKVDGVEFDSYRIKYTGSWNRRNGDNATGRVENLAWYAPEAKGFVNWTHTIWSSDGRSRTDTTTDLVKWEPKLVK